MAATPEELIDLLAEWFEYWDQQDHMPTKMPNALHTRTAVALVTSGRWPMAEPWPREPGPL